MHPCNETTLSHYRTKVKRFCFVIVFGKKISCVSSGKAHVMCIFNVCKRFHKMWGIFGKIIVYTSEYISNQYEN